jgi:hypothetical protein
MIPTTVSYRGISNVTRWSYVRSRGIVPGTFVLDCVPQTVNATPATLTVTFGDLQFTFPDMVASEETLLQSHRLRGFNTKVHLLDHRWRWKFGAISGRYNVRLPNGTVDPTTAATPAQLATLCLQAMGESGFDVSRMPTGMWPPADWQNDNPAEALDKLCRYVACEITGGELGQVVIYPLGVGEELPEGKFINQPFPLVPWNRPRLLVLQGGPTVFQSRLKLAAVARNADTALPLTTLSPYAASVDQSPFSYPDIDTAQERTDAFQSVYKWFYTKSQADGSHTLPGSLTAISKGTQYRLLNTLIDSWLNPDAVRVPVIPGVVGKFWPRGSDADEQTDIITYNGQFAMDAARNLVTFPYPLWNLDSEGAIKAPELYLNTAYHVANLTGGLETFQSLGFVGGDAGARVLRRPEIFYSVKHSYSVSNAIESTVTTLGQAQTEAQAYLNAFFRSYQESEQREIEWGGLENVRLDGRIAQLTMSGGTAHKTLMRGSRMAEHGIFGPTSQEQRRNRFVDAWLEGADVTA